MSRLPREVLPDESRAVPEGSRFGFLKRLALRAIRPHTAQQQMFNAVVADRIELQEAVFREELAALHALLPRALGEAVGPAIAGTRELGERMTGRIESLETALDASVSSLGQGLSARMTAVESDLAGRLANLEAGLARIEGAAPAGRPGITIGDVYAAYRLLLEREPESYAMVRGCLLECSTVSQLRNRILGSEEFEASNHGLMLPSEPVIVIAELGSGLRLFVDVSDAYIGLQIARGDFEAEEAALIRSVLEPGDTAVDVGANVGYFSVLMADRVGPKGHILAFEPVSANAALLRRSLKENGFTDRVTLTQALVGSAAGSARLAEPGSGVKLHSSGAAFLLSEGSAPPSGWTESELPMVTLDDATKERRVKLVKMDVEGAEPFVIAGARRFLAAQKPVVVCELNPYHLKHVADSSPTALIEEMRVLGFACRDLAGAPVEAYGEDRVLNVVFRAAGG